MPPKTNEDYIEEFQLLQEDMLLHPKDYNLAAQQNNINWLRTLLTEKDHQLQKAREEERERIKGLLQGWEASERTNFDSDEEYQLHRQKVGAINWYTRLVHGWIDDADHSKLDQDKK